MKSYIIYLLFILFFIGRYISLVAFAGEVVPLNLDDDIYSKLSTDEKTIIAEYHKAYFPLKNYYMNLFISAQCKSYVMTNSEGLPLPAGTPPILSRIEDFEFRSNTNDKNIFLRMDTTIYFFQADNKTIKKGNAENFVSKHIGILTPEKGYLIQKNKNDARYFSLVAARELNNVLIKANIFENAVYASMGTPLEHYIFKRFPNPNLSQYYIASVTQTKENNHPIVEITIYLHRKESSQKSVLKIKLFRQSWMVKEIFFRDLTPNAWWMKESCEYNYNDANDQYPKLKYVQVERGIFEQEKQRTKQKEEYFITNIIPGAVALSEFDVNQFLPPEAKIGIKKTAFPYFRLICVLLGLLSLAIGIFLKKRVLRNNK
ncbi:MAG: hypothetical protein LBP59_12725 [Planctomycetaceae bacterium]|jgi:hypothetical protein|nr:hypothetical protein [Planctomycetaceae bacterium]